MPPGPHSALGDGAFLSPETQLDALLQEMQAAQKREQMMKLAAMVQGMGQTPPPPGMPPPQLGGGQPGGPQGRGQPGQQLRTMLGKTRGIGRIPGTSGAPLGYPGGVPGAAAGAGASRANLLQQLAMKRRGPQGSVARSPYAGFAGRRF